MPLRKKGKQVASCDLVPTREDSDTINTEAMATCKGQSTQHTKTALRNSSLYAKPLNTLENFISFFASIPSVWIDSTVEATGKHLQFGLTALLP